MKNGFYRAIARGSFMLLAAFGFLASNPVLAIDVGQTVKNPDIRDASDKPATIPDFGKKVLAIFYTDPDVSDMNDAFADLLKAADLPDEKYRGMGIANLKDTWKPNSLVRVIIRRKIEKYDATILTDPDLLLAQAWNLGPCNEQSVVIVLDKTGTVRYYKKGAMSKAEQESTLALIKELIAQ